MKVLHLIGGGDVGGAKTHVLSLVKELGNYIDIKLISFRHGAFAEDAQAMGINVQVVNTGNIVSDIKNVINTAKDENFNIIHSHGAKANMIAVIAGHFVKIPTVTTVHSDYRLDYLRDKYKMFSFGLINTVALRFIDYYVAVSRNFRQMLIERKFNPDRIFTVYNGMDFSESVGAYSRAEFSKKYNLNLSDDDILVGILARLDPVKGVGTFLQAAREVIKHNPSVKFLIGGDGDERKSLEKKASELGITNNVFFMGWVKDNYEFMGNIDINVLTSLSESFPYVILEGTKCRRATVSSDVGGISDLIDDGENGFLFKPRDYRKLAEHILNLSYDKALRASMGEKLYQKAEQQFSLDNMCKTQLQIYDRVAAGGR